MTGWLLEHHSAVQFYAWLSVFGFVAVWESYLPRRTLATATAVRWSRNLSFAALDILVARLCVPVTGFAVAVWAKQVGWGVLNILPLPSWLSLVLAVAALDLGSYAIHRLLHAVPALWRCHKIHHSDLDFDCSTALRHHPLEYLIVAAASPALVALLGAPPVAVVVAVTLDLAVSVFNHGNAALPPGIDAVLRRLLVTPDMHRIHHSALVAEGNRNFGNVFPWWDRVFATYQSAPVREHRSMDLGLAEARSPAEVTLPKLLLLPFRSGHAVASA
jgi:sterol desaturase/sphingolipid hydroxylase (fatty acid hydroxylase superfamily)